MVLAGGSAVNWWLRDAVFDNTTNFYNVNTSGSINNNNASNSNGVVPGFARHRQDLVGNN